jgi:excisionase family DNA binding protein
VEDKRTASTEGLLSLNDLTQYLSCSRTFAAKLISDGTIPSLKIGGLRRVRRSDVVRYIEARLAAKG